MPPGMSSRSLAVPTLNNASLENTVAVGPESRVGWASALFPLLHPHLEHLVIEDASPSRDVTVCGFWIYKLRAFVVPLNVEQQAHLLVLGKGFDKDHLSAVI